MSVKAQEDFLAELARAFELISEAPERWPLYLYGTRRVLLKEISI